MRALVFNKPGEPLHVTDLPIPEPGPGQVLVRVRACAVCRTDLHIIDGELPNPKVPLIPGHEIVGVVEKNGPGASRYSQGSRVGIPWLGWTCGVCQFCRSGQENLCDNARFTGYTLNGGYAEYAVADERFAFSLPNGIPDAEAAPLLCAGLIGYRAYRFVGQAQRVGFYGFGAAAHILAQIAFSQNREVYAFTRPGDTVGQSFARHLGAAWAGDSSQLPPQALDAAIIFAPAGALVPAALSATRKGGVVVCAGIHMSDIPSFPYALLWGERCIRSVANLTRQDGEDFFSILKENPVHTEVTTYPLSEGERALADLRLGKIQGAAVLLM